MACPFKLPVPGERASHTINRFRSEGGPVVRVELPGQVPAWAVVAYESVNEVLSNDGILFSKNPRNYTALNDGTIPEDWPLRQVVDGDHLLTKDGADHRRLRGLVNRAFTPARVQALAPRIQEMTDEFLDRMAEEGDRVDLVRLFSEPLPVAVICELFGVPHDERRQIRDWSLTLLSHETSPEEAVKTGGDLLAYLAAFIDRKRGEPGDDLTTGLIRVQEDDGDRLSDTEMVWILWLVLIAGHETTVHLIANAVVALCSDPAQLAMARAENAWDRAVEETLRARNSVINVMFRYPMREVRVSGVTIKEGEPIMVGIGGAGTDPARFGEHAERFDLSRDQETHLGFGRGPHFCLGAPLARLECRIALSSLFSRFPDLRLDVGADDIAYVSSIITEGPVTLPVVLGPVKDG
ncbi:cytochrome P450 [Nonomuraea sp. NPDC046802]|uniref:cytochrome P450 family protein n=1 Tax=Nonomuraea sp. NPDC046802 TaxID=3154919 RepID=UPI00340FBD39